MNSVTALETVAYGVQNEALDFEINLQSGPRP